MAGLDPERREPEGLLRGGEHLARVGLEGEHGERRAEGARDAPAFLDDRAMAQMDAIEIADGDHRAPRVCGRALPMSNDAHGRVYPNPSGRENSRGAQARRWLLS